MECMCVCWRELSSPEAVCLLLSRLIYKRNIHIWLSAGCFQDFGMLNVILLKKLLPLHVVFPYMPL